jgi:hypothetical protein
MVAELSHWGLTQCLSLLGLAIYLDFFYIALSIPLFGLFIASTLDKCTCSLSGHSEFVLHWKERLNKSRL